MKRILLCLLLCLLLCGCGAPEPTEATTMPPATTPATTETPTEPAGSYVPFSDLEAQTDGAVRYFLPEATCYGIRTMENGVLAFCGLENTTLVRYTGQQLYAAAALSLDCRVDPEDTSFQISTNGITYYDPEARAVVFLDNDLKEVQRLPMPAEMQGKPVLSANRMQIYYCTGDAVRVYDTTTGLDRMLKSISYAQQGMEDVLLGDTVLYCSLTDERGAEYSLFLSVETGETLAQIPAGARIQGKQDWICARVPEGIQELLVFGQPGQTMQVLTPSDAEAPSWYLEDTGSLITASLVETVTRLDYYDLASGRRTASVELAGTFAVKSVARDLKSGKLLIQAFDEKNQMPVLLSWDWAACAVEDAKVYTGPRYTAQSPDREGLAVCAQLAQQIGQTYGLHILIGEDAVAHQPWDYTLEMEYQTQVIRRQLGALEAVLAHFPQGFFEGLYGQPNICIVRSIRGNAQSGSLEAAQGLQFWDGDSPFVALAAGESLERSFYHEMFHVMDSRILSETRAYYYWHNLNPEGCVYFEDYTSYRTADVSQYLQEEDRVFIDAYSMCYPKEDRARIMEYACMAGNEQFFQSEIMQKKLETLCKGIREAFRLEAYQQPLLWEQYLKEPLKLK